MKRSGLLYGVRVFVTFVSACGASGFAQAQNGKPADPACEQRVAAASFATAIMQTREAKTKFDGLRAKFAPRQAQVASLANEVEALRKQLDGAQHPLSDTERNAQIQNLNTKQKQLERAEEDLQNDSRAEAEETYRQIEQKMLAVVQSYAERHGFTLVLDRGTADAPPILMYANDNVDITRELTAAYDAETPSGLPERNQKPGQSPTPPAHPTPQTGKPN